MTGSRDIWRMAAAFRGLISSAPAQETAETGLTKWKFLDAVTWELFNADCQA
jgi:hypothetical protein